MPAKDTADGAETALTDAVRAHLKLRNLGIREAARESGLALQTLHSFLNRPGGLASAETRAALVKLGMSPDIVDLLAARQAGLSVPVELDAFEASLLTLRRSLSKDDRVLFEDVIGAWLRRHKDRHAEDA
jgi:lambda repressor-like predicted transcriptional regulator